MDTIVLEINERNN